MLYEKSCYVGPKPPVSTIFKWPEAANYVNVAKNTMICADSLKEYIQQVWG